MVILGDTPAVTVGVHTHNDKSLQNTGVTTHERNGLVEILSQITARHPDLAIVIAIWLQPSDEIRWPYSKSLHRTLFLAYEVFVIHLGLFLKFGFRGVRYKLC